ncbi:MAG: molybdopterin molybdotransferase MoeA [Chloroflexi bacterium]|nr:molybdopterin molybdotransferase MoeA [Chloroflexota bacterium]
MLTVKTLDDTLQIIRERFGMLRSGKETVPIREALGRFLAVSVTADEFVPDFNRSTVDGFAVRAVDVQGSSDSIPAILTCVGEVHMGQGSFFRVGDDQCASVPTGGEVPAGADSVVMMEFVEAIGGGQYAFYKPSPPGSNMIIRGEDGKPGDLLLWQGKRLNSADLGTLSALGSSEVSVSTRPKVGIISTGDELVNPGEPLGPGQIRDVNQVLMRSLVEENDGIAKFYGIVIDEVSALRTRVVQAVAECDLVLVSGGTSVGERDAMAKVLSQLGEIFVHGIAVKPGKPTLLGKIDDKPIFGLPGNPVACFFIFNALVKPLLLSLQGAEETRVSLPAKLTRAVSSNHGRAEFVLVELSGSQAAPIPSKSGLISTVSKANGYFVIQRDQEGLPAGADVEIYLF